MPFQMGKKRPVGFILKDVRKEMSRFMPYTYNNCGKYLSGSNFIYNDSGLAFTTEDSDMKKSKEKVLEILKKSLH